MYKISVIIPVYNVRQYIDEALNSVVDQTYPNLEIIVVDDGSYDGSEAICDEYARKDFRIRVIHQENKGLSAARNAGLDIASGEYIAFLDPDDAYHREMLQTMVDIAQKEHSDIVLCNSLSYTTKNKMKEPSLKSGFVRRFTKTEAMHGVINGDISCLAWDKLYARHIWEGIRYPTGHLCEDIAVLFPLLERTEKLCRISYSFVMHRERHNSITHAITVGYLKDYKYARTIYEGYVQSHISEIFTQDMLRQCKQSRLNYYMIEFSKCCIDFHGERKKCRRMLKKEIEELIISEGLESFDFTSQIGYYMFRHCPLAILPMYTGYKTLQNIMHIKNE